MGEVYVPSELERIMYDESIDIIRNIYDNTEGSKNMALLISRAKRGKNLLTLTNLDKKIKLVNMPRTFEFTRPYSMLQKLLETMFYIIISNTQSFIYMSMIWSMFMNAGIISLIYPILVFGYALLEETRPRKEFWVFIREYTTFILFLKFVMNLSIFDNVLGS